MFSAITNFMSLVANLCVLFLTFASFYLTTFSNRIKSSGIGFSTSMFYGESFIITLVNRTLHAIPIQEIFAVVEENGSSSKCGNKAADQKKNNNKGTHHYSQVQLFKSKDAILDSWMAKTFQTDPFTEISGWTDYDIDKKTADVRAIGVDTGTGRVIWILRPHRAKHWIKVRRELHCIKKQHRQGLIQSHTLIRNAFNGTVVSKDVRYAILIKPEYTSNNTNTVFANDFVMSDYVCGGNGFDMRVVDASDIEDCFTKTLHIPKSDFTVIDLKDNGTGKT